MKSSLIVWLLALCTTAFGTTPVEPQEDPEFAAIMAGLSEPDQAGLEVKEKYLQRLARADAVVAKARDYFEKHPTSPRRFDALLLAAGLDRWFVSDIVGDPEKDGVKAFVIDADKTRAWKTTRQLWLKEIWADSAAPEEIQERALALAAVFLTSEAASSSDPGLAGAREKLRVLKDRFPDGDGTRFAWQTFLKTMERLDRAAFLLELKQLKMDGPSNLQQLATGMLQLAESKDTPFEMQFTALDGRQVDVAQLRGKVVLIEFWATWCGPCIEEIPNIKKLYDQYHATGFEVIGVALENARLNPSDTPEQRNAKLEQARNLLVKFTTEHDMPWPQYFDGKWWKTDIASRYSINSIPAMFLLDREGRVVTTEARGPKLEAEVKRLLMQK